MGHVLIYEAYENSWTGPHKVIDRDKRVLKIDYGNRLVQFYLNRSKPYRIDEEIKNRMSDQDSLAEIDFLKEAKDCNRNGHDGTETKFWDISKNEKDPFKTLLLHTLKPDNLRTQKYDFHLDKKNKVEGSESGNN